MQENTASNETKAPVGKANKKTLYIIIGIIVTLVAGLLGYWYWTRTPQYSLQRIHEAVEKHDLPLFDKLVDLDTIIPRAIDQLVDAKLNKPDEVRDETMNKFAMGFLNAMKPALAATAKEQIRSYVEKGNFEQPQKKGENKEKNELKVDELYKNTGGGTAEFKGVEYVKEEGKVAVVGVKIFYPKLGRDVILEFKMRELDGYWQLAEISNLREFLLQVEKLEKEKLAEINKPIVAKMNQGVKLGAIKMTAGYNDAWGISRVVRFTTVLTNTSTQAIVALEGVINVKSSEGKYLVQYPVRLGNNALINPGAAKEASWTKDINRFIKSDEALYQAVDSKTTIEFVVDYIKFADGSELKLVEKLP